MSSSEAATKTGVNAKSTFGGNDFDWMNYERFRPAYPQALYDAIFAFHAAHNPDFSPSSITTVYDFGCGPGTTFAPLLAKFTRAIGVDVNKPQLDAILKRFPDEVAKGRVEVVEGKAEEVAERVKEGTVDLVVAAEAIHWFDTERWFAGVGKMLKPGGTAAVIQYSFDELDDEEANAIWQSYLRSTLTNRPRPAPPAPAQPETESDKPAAAPPPPPAPPRNGGGMGLMTSLLDTLAIPSPTFTSETRFHWPTPFQSSSPFVPPSASAYQSMRGPFCTYTTHPVSEPLLRQKRTRETLLKSLKTLGNLVQREEEYDGGKEMRAAVDGVVEVYKRKYGKEDPEFEARWPCALVLASKKK